MRFCVKIQGKMQMCNLDTLIAVCTDHIENVDQEIHSKRNPNYIIYFKKRETIFKLNILLTSNEGIEEHNTTKMKSNFLFVTYQTTLPAKNSVDNCFVSTFPIPH